MSTNSENSVLKPGILFKGVGSRTNINNPDNLNIQWAPKGSYRIENMVNTIKKEVPNLRKDLFSTEKDFGIYILDDYSVHVTKEIKDELWKKGWVLGNYYT